MLCSIYWLYSQNNTHDLIEYNKSYSKKVWKFRTYYRDKPIANYVNAIVYFTNNSDSNSFNFKGKINQTGRLIKQWYKRCWNNDTIKISE